MNNIEIKNLNDVRKKEIEEKIQSLSEKKLSESMSARAVESFQKSQFELEKLQTILFISNKTETPIRDVEKFDQLAHSVLHMLVVEGEVGAAKKVIAALQKLL